MFNIAIRYYKNNNRKIKFYNLYISDTYGKGDNRRKILPIKGPQRYAVQGPPSSILSLIKCCLNLFS